MRLWGDTWSEQEVKRARRQRRTRRDREELRRLRRENESLRGEIEQLKIYRSMAYLDYLTGLRNRRYFEERMSQELSRASRAEAPCSVLILDIDNFKAINDELGHPTGDRVLRGVGELLQKNQRAMDVACRLGGDEFAVILPGATREGVEALRARLELAQHDGLAGLLPATRVTLSFGAATYPEDGEDVAHLLAHADRAMYVDKRRRKASTPGAKLTAV
jgi:diguanylate cyclase